MRYLAWLLLLVAARAACADLQPGEIIEALKLKPQPAAPSAASAPAPDSAGEAPRPGRTRILLPEPVPAAERPSLSMPIKFDFDSARLTAEGRQQLATLATALASRELEPHRFGLEGHTDAKGSVDYNQKLSEARAFAVRDELVRLGIDTRRLAPAGKGSTQPANPADPLAPENRRVRIVNLP